MSRSTIIFEALVVCLLLKYRPYIDIYIDIRAIAVMSIR